jgi:outer membrane protein assembly factor BamB
VYVAGDTGTGADWRIQQLDATGKPGWQFDFASENVDVPLALTLTAGGQIVAGGLSFGSEDNGRDAIVIALTPDGREQWRYLEMKPGQQVCHGVAADPAGNLYLAAEAEQRWDVFSLDGQGKLRWRYEDGTKGGANAIAVNPDGSVYVAGEEPQAWRVIKLNPDRTLAWEHRVAGRAAAKGVRVTADGGAVVVGTHTINRLNLRVERLGAAGNVVWEYEATSPAGPITGRAVTVDGDDRPIVVGEIGTDWLVLALDAQGKRRWHFAHDGGGGLKNRDQAFAVAFQSPSTVLVAGRVHPLPPEPPSLGPVEWRVAAYREP